MVLVAKKKKATYVERKGEKEMNQNVVKNVRNTRTASEVEKLMEQRRERLGDKFCETCERWSYGIGNKRCEIHNPKKKAL